MTADIASSKMKVDPTKWTSTDKATFINKLIEAKENALSTDSGFKPKVWMVPCVGMKYHIM